MLKHLWQRWRGGDTGPSSETESEAALPPLSDADHELLFDQVTEGVLQGWNQPRVQKFFAQMGDRGNTERWVAWLQRYGDRVLASSPDYNLAARLLKYAEADPSALGDAAKVLGQRILAQQQTPLAESVPMTDAIEALFTAGNELYQQGSVVKAIEAWDEAIALKPDFYQAWANRGVALASSGRYTEALASYDQALAIAPDAHDTWSNRGIALRNLDRNEDALASYDQALALKPDYLEAQINRCVVLVALKRLQEALQGYTQVVSLAPQRYEVWLGYGNVMHQLQDLEEAVAAWDRALNLQPNAVLIWEQRGQALLKLKRYEESLASFDQVLAVQPFRNDLVAIKDFLLEEIEGRASRQAYAEAQAEAESAANPPQDAPDTPAE